MKNITDYYAVTSLSKISPPALIGSLVGFIIGAVALIQSVDFLNSYFKEERMVLEIQQDLQENQFFSIWLKGISDTAYQLDNFKFRTSAPAIVKLQYDDLTTPILLTHNSKLVGYSYTVSKDELEKLSNQKSFSFESQKPLFLFVEFEQVVGSPRFDCEFTGSELDPTLSNPKSQSIDCGVEELGYVNFRKKIIWGAYVMLALFISSIVILPLVIIRKIKGGKPINPLGGRAG